MKKVYETHIIDEDGPYTTQFETAGDPYVWVWDNLDPESIEYIKLVNTTNRSNNNGCIHHKLFW